MKLWILSAAALTLAAATPAAAQFTAVPPEKMKAPPVVPARLPDGHPNWTGVWVPPNGLLDAYRGPSGISGLPPGVEVNVPTVRKDIPPMKSPYKERYEAAVKQALAGTLPDPVSACFPPSATALMVAPYGMEILQTPKTIAITSEAPAAGRRIWMDLKEHPPADELDPSYSGHSIGHWEGDALVVDTVGIHAAAPLDYTFLPHSEKTHIVERFTQVAPGVLVDDVTVEDPDVFIGPWKYKMAYVYKPNFRIKEYVCLENNRNIDAEGRVKFDK